MPILQVRALPQPDPARIEPSLKAACLAIAEAYGCPPSHVWGTWEELVPGRYVEGDRGATLQPAESHPPIARLTVFEGKPAETMERVLLAGARALSEGLGIPGNVFLSVEVVRAGQVVAGDGVVRLD